MLTPTHIIIGDCSVSECECHSHSTSCTYNATQGHGVCDVCIHNTTGPYCERCLDGFYHDPALSLDHPDTCRCKYAVFAGTLAHHICKSQAFNFMATVVLYLLIMRAPSGCQSPILQSLWSRMLTSTRPFVLMSLLIASTLHTSICFVKLCIAVAPSISN